MTMVPVEEAAQQLQEGKAFQRIKVMHGGSFGDTRTILLVPTRGMIHHRTIQAINSLMTPMNGNRALMFCAGDEVGVAYNKMIANILADPVLSTWPYIMTIEDDNLVPPDAHIRLLESITQTGADASSGIYFTKGDWNMPMAYGDPDEYQRTGVLDFRPRTPRECITAMENEGAMRVNGIAMGCALWRMDLFRKMEPPWFVTVSDVIDGVGRAYTQDLYFCERATRAGRRFVVDFRVRVGHLDVRTGEVY